jgi:hypothetical protein
VNGLREEVVIEKLYAMQIDATVVCDVQSMTV